ncbi:MAG: prolipoprotein diacylglyceryl transferase [Clostridiales bacterium]|jgi:phosphatidylglycerol:prolipoprotein diacylglycerol transferase|nr:prolipoprotein diacylglyceryl transferase [Clostridiales bacterium]
MNPIAFRIFGQPIYWYGILISIGVLLGIVLALRNAKYFDIDQDSIIDMALLAIPLAIVGARLYYVIFEWEQYRDNIWSIFNIRKGGLAIFGGVIGGALGVIIYSRRKKLSFWDLADICAPSLILGQAIGRWGNYINQEAYGFAVNNPEWQWFPAAVYIDATQQWHLATFFYESFWNFIVFFILMSYRKYRIRNGEIFLLYLVLYSFGRFFIEGLRTDSLYIGTIRVSQLLSVLFFILGIALIIYRRRTLSKKISVVNNVTEMKQYKSSKSDSEGCRNSMDDDTDNE